MENRIDKLEEALKSTNIPLYIDSSFFPENLFDEFSYKIDGNCSNEELDNKIKECIQKIGIVRYNAYSDAGNDLSFAVAMLDDKNNGIVFNGIYSREMSNIYAKPIVDGKSKYNLTEEENEALKKAINSEENNNL